MNPEVDSVGRSIGRIFNYLTSNIKTYPSHRGTIQGLGYPGAMTALSFLTDLYAKIGNGESELTSDILETEFKRHFPDAYYEDVFVEPGFECQYDSIIKVFSTVIYVVTILSL